MSGLNVAGVQFRRAGRLYSFDVGRHDVRIGDHVVVETERGQALAKVITLSFEDDSKFEDKLKPILRRAKDQDLKVSATLTEENCERDSRALVKDLGLDMQILKAEVQFGGNKVILYFNAPQRVDFRDLVKKLATTLRSRVELKQIGARDETKIIGGVGICGREFCCSSFLREFVPVSIKMAKNQNLALNPTKISGGCGRLLCCLTYEDDLYTDLKKELPREGLIVETVEGRRARVRSRDIFNQKLLLEFEDGTTERVTASGIKRTKQPQQERSQEREKVEETTWGDDLDLDDLMKDM